MERIGRVYGLPQGNNSLDILIASLESQGYTVNESPREVLVNLPGGKIVSLPDSKVIFRGKKQVGKVNMEEITIYEPERGPLTNILDTFYNDSTVTFSKYAPE